MDKRNLVLFIALVLAMVAVAQHNMRGGGLTVLGKTLGSRYAGTPDVRPPFPRDGYNVTVGADGVTVLLSENISSEYNGIFLSVYAYDDKGRHVVKFKRVVDGRIFIGSDEDASFIVEFKGNNVSNIVKPDIGTKFAPKIKDAIAAGRYYGLEHCLLGKQGETICPVYALELVKDDDEYGRIKPVINRDSCIKDGLCTAVCPTKLLYRRE